MRKSSLMTEMTAMRHREITKLKYGHLLPWMYIVNGCKCMTSMVVWGGGVGNGERGGGGCLMSRGVSLEHRGT